MVVLWVHRENWDGKKSCERSGNVKKMCGGLGRGKVKYLLLDGKMYQTIEKEKGIGC